jgi:hypothetical protein
MILMKDSFRVGISSPPDREKLVAEIIFGDEQWAEINQEQAELQVQFYARQSGEPWMFNLSDAMTALEKARQRLLQRS